MERNSIFSLSFKSLHFSYHFSLFNMFVHTYSFSVWLNCIVFRLFNFFYSVSRVMVLFLYVILAVPPLEMVLLVELTICKQCYLYIVGWEVVTSSGRKGNKSTANTVHTFFYCGYSADTRKTICVMQMYFLCGRCLLVVRLCLLRSSPGGLFSKGCDYTSLKFHPLDLSFQK